MSACTPNLNVAIYCLVVIVITRIKPSRAVSRGSIVESEAPLDGAFLGEIGCAHKEL